MTVEQENRIARAVDAARLQGLAYVWGRADATRELTGHGHGHALDDKAGPFAEHWAELIRAHESMETGYRPSIQGAWNEWDEGN